MSIERDLAQALQGDAGIRAYVGDRVYPDYAPSDVPPPLIVYQTVDTPRLHAMGSVVTAAEPRIQIGIWARERADAEALAPLVIDAVLALKHGTETVHAHLIDNEATDYDQVAELYRRRIDVILVHSTREMS